MQPIHVGFHIGKRISTSHFERTNQSVRPFTWLLTRVTLGYSKRLANLKHATACSSLTFQLLPSHGAQKLTPAMASGITGQVWTVEQLLTDLLRQVGKAENNSTKVVDSFYYECFSYGRSLQIVVMFGFKAGRDSDDISRICRTVCWNREVSTYSLRL